MHTAEHIIRRLKSRITELESEVNKLKKEKRTAWRRTNTYMAWRHRKDSMKN